MSKTNVNLTVQIPKELDQQLGRASKKNLLSKSAFVRTALLDAIRQQKIVRPDPAERKKEAQK